MEFVSLHTHTTYSFQDGHGLPEEHVERVAELGMRAVAFTEHGNVSSHASGEKAAKKHGIKFIPGLEAYTALDHESPRKFHMTLLAKNQEGYRSLNELVTQSYRDFYRWPTVLRSGLRDRVRSIVATSGCADGHLACVLLGGKGLPEQERPNISGAREVATEYRDLFAERSGAFYLEVQVFPELERCRAINRCLAQLASELDIDLVATADIHLVRPTDRDLRPILHTLGRGGSTVAATEEGWMYDIPCWYPDSDTFVLSQLEATGLTENQAISALENTGKITDMCDVELPKGEMPGYRYKDGDERWEENELG